MKTFSIGTRPISPMPLRMAGTTPLFNGELWIVPEYGAKLEQLYQLLSAEDQEADSHNVNTFALRNGGSVAIEQNANVLMLHRKDGNGNSPAYWFIRNSAYPGSNHAYALSRVERIPGRKTAPEPRDKSAVLKLLDNLVIPAGQPQA